MVQQKDEAIAKQQRRAMAQLLEVRTVAPVGITLLTDPKQNKEESARIRVENIIRSDLTTELLEILELYCELLIARIGLLEAKECDPGLEEAVKSLLYAAPRTEIKELHTVRMILAEKFGKEFALAASENSDGKVSSRVLDRLRVEPPKKELVEAYLTTIAEAYGVDWPLGRKAAQEAEHDDDNDDEPSGGQKVPALEEPLANEELSKATPPRSVGPKSPVSVVPPSPRTDNVAPTIKLPGAPELKPGSKMAGRQAQSSANGAAAKKDNGAIGGSIPTADDLAKRFAQLKR